MKKVIATLILLISLGVLVCANTMTGVNDAPYNVEVSVVKGWNIIAGIMPNEAITSDSEIQASDIKAVWYYAPNLRRYVQIHPEVDMSANIDDDVALTSAMWVYSNKDGILKYSTLEDYMPLSMRQLSAGWNFVTITPDMSGSSFEDITRDCDIEKVYHFEQIVQEWSSNLVNDNFMNEHLTSDSIGLGLIVKVTNDCTLGESSGISPPPLPGNGNNTGLRKTIEDYYYEELAYEECDLNNADDYNSQTDCDAASRCVAQKYASLVPESDLQEVADLMEEQGGESGALAYEETNTAIRNQFNNAIPPCLIGRHINY